MSEEKAVKQEKKEKKESEVEHPLGEKVFGDLGRIQSGYVTERKWTDIQNISEADVGQEVWVRARVHKNRTKGKLTFIILRRGFSSIQLVLRQGPLDKLGCSSPEFVKFAQKVPHESVIEVLVMVVKPQSPVLSTSQLTVELSNCRRFYVISRSATVLPFQLEDAGGTYGDSIRLTPPGAMLAPYPPASASSSASASYSPSGGAGGYGAGTAPAGTAPAGTAPAGTASLVSTETRLDNRVIDLRTAANHAIFRLQSRVCEYYRAFFISQGFIEIHTPKIISGVSEGGSEVFKFDYMGKDACLAQSPQLHKQESVMADLFKVFEIGHVFRAEHANTHRHLCEFVGLDFEMEIKESYRECMTMLDECLNFIFDMINKHCQPELSAVRKQYPFEPLRYGRNSTYGKPLILTFQEAKQLLLESEAEEKETKETKLEEKGGDEKGGVRERSSPMDDFTTPEEKKLGKIIAAKYGTDFYMIEQYPAAVRPFYTMPSSTNPGYSNSYDVFLRGEEITSGAQRVHELELLKAQATAKKVPHSNIQSYLDAFKFGAYPHGGAGIGLERVVMLFLGLDNIRKTSMFPRTPTRLSP